MSNEQAYKDAITLVASNSLTPSDYREMVIELARETPEAFLALAESHGRYKSPTVNEEGITEDDKELLILFQQNDSLVPAIQHRREQMKVKGGEGLKESKDYVMALREKYPDYASIAKAIGSTEAKKYTLGELLKEKLDATRKPYEGEGEF